MIRFIDDHRDKYEVEPVCAQLPIAPSSYNEHKARKVDPDRLPPWVHRDQAPCLDIQPIWDENFEV
jgi:hypothetical protein